MELGTDCLHQMQCRLVLRYLGIMRFFRGLPQSFRVNADTMLWTIGVVHVRFAAYRTSSFCQ